MRNLPDAFLVPMEAATELRRSAGLGGPGRRGLLGRLPQAVADHSVQHRQVAEGNNAGEDELRDVTSTLQF